MGVYEPEAISVGSVVVLAAMLSVDHPANVQLNGEPEHALVGVADVSVTVPLTVESGEPVTVPLPALRVTVYAVVVKV